jgi:hypothetical protein
MTGWEKGRNSELEIGNWKFETRESRQIAGSGFEVRAPRKREKMGETRNSKIPANFQFPISGSSFDFHAR